MSPSRSDEPSANDPLRPDDYADASESVQSPALSPVEWLRWGWRQLTSMRTALVLLLLLAIAAVPGSIVPQRSADPNGVTQYYADNPDLAPVLDSLQLFDVYTSAWFSAIYLLLFVSLIGCVIPRTKHHFTALKARPPRTPVRLSRLDEHREDIVDLTADPATGTADAAAAAETAVQLAATHLKKAGYRIERYDGRGSLSVSAERGYARETGNLVFHSALVGVLVAVGVGGGLTYTGQAVIIEGGTFVNSMLDYASFNPGRFVDPDRLTPYSVTLDEFAVTYQPPGAPGAGQAGDYEAHITTQLAGGDAHDAVVRVNHPVDVAGDRVYLMGNGYAPEITIRNADGDVVYREAVPFLPQDTSMTSLGVVKVPDGLPEQLGLVGFFYPTAQELTTGALASVYPDLVYPVLTLDVYAGDLGIDDGTPRSVYTLDPTGMEKLAGRGTDVDAIRLMPGEYAELPDGLGTITFDDISSAAAPVEAGSDVSHAADYSDSVARFVSLSVHRDVGAPWVLAFALLALAGLLAALFVPRRRVWVKVTPDADTLRIEYAALARGEDPGLGAALDDVVRAHVVALDDALSRHPEPDPSQLPAGPPRVD